MLNLLPTRRKWNYRTNCTEETARAITHMVDSATKISRSTFFKYVDREALRAVEDILGYDAHPAQGLTMAGDAYVTYWKSRFRGHDCVYFSQSGIEYIFY